MFCGKKRIQFEKSDQNGLFPGDLVYSFYKKD